MVPRAIEKPMALKLFADDGSSSDATPDDAVRLAIDRASHLLPAQGPIAVFIHHNTLHAFEDRPFDEAVQAGAALFGCEPYLREERYRAEMTKGRIRRADLEAVLDADADPHASQRIDGLTNRRDLRLMMLETAVGSPASEELAYHLAESQALSRVRADVAAATKLRIVAETRRWVLRDVRQAPPPVLAPFFSRLSFEGVEHWRESAWEAFALKCVWEMLRAGLTHAAIPQTPSTKPARHRDRILDAFNIDTDLGVQDVLTRFTSAFLDQGVSHWVLPNREAGFFRCFLRTYRRPVGPPDAWLRSLTRESNRLLDRNVTPLQCIRESLQKLDVPATEWDDSIAMTVLALRGWGGMVHQVAQRGDSIAHPIPKRSFEEFLAVRLLLDRLAIEETLAANGSSLQALPKAQSPPRPTDDERVYPLFQLAQLFGWTPEQLTKLTPKDWAELYAEVEAFPSLERRRVFQGAYERRFRSLALDAVSLNARHVPNRSRPRFQTIHCLDEREESFRRHLEETAQDCTTYGAAGFFNVVMYYRGAADAHFIPLCPIVLTPERWVEEQVVDHRQAEHERRRKARKVLVTYSDLLQRGSRSFAFGALLSAGVGVLASLPLVLRVLYPRLTGRLHDRLGSAVTIPPQTELCLERTSEVPGPENGARGFTVAEMATAAERLLRDIGLIDGFARLVFILGHGSDSLNNPHKSAYDCGACGGSSGAPNGRALAQMLNDPGVRIRIAANGIVIPADTWFVGGYHDTCIDSVVLADRDRVPESHREELVRIEAEFRTTGDRNAHERSRRFMSAPLNQSAPEARLHVENRSQDLAQVRPELGHATNAMIVVGRRERSRGLFLDRRAFLASYDPTQDDAEGFTLARILGAAVPVCGGINLEYYFSHVDNPGYGCGSKLPHNITGLLGVMDGAASDLRTGLPWQMVEIHEPVRLLFVVETRPEILLKVMARNPTVDSMIRNGWVQLALLDPDSADVSEFRNGRFVPYRCTSDFLPTALSSVDWYRGWREHLEFASIRNSEASSFASSTPQPIGK